MHTARDLLAAALLIAATVLGALWLPAVWLAEHVIDRDGFLQTTQPLADDAEFQRTLTDSAVDEILEGANIPGWLADSVEPTLAEQAGELTGTEIYGTIWDATMIELHGALFTPGPSDLEVDLAPVIDTLLGGVESKLPLDIPRPESAMVTLATIPDVPLLPQAAALGPWVHLAGPVALVLLVLAVVISGHRRMLLLLAGAAAMVAGAFTGLLAQNIETVVPDRVDQSTFLGPIVRVFEEGFAAGLLPQSVILLGVGALVAAAALVLMGLRRI